MGSLWGLWALLWGLFWGVRCPPPTPPRPVIVVHGLLDSARDFGRLQEFIAESHPGTNVSVLDLFDRGQSLRPLWVQVEGFRRAVGPIMANAAGGVHLICYSQGGLICRALLCTMEQHNVHSFISLAAPQMGQYGDTQYLRWLFPRHMKSNLYRLCYTALGQGVSICNYWNDPHHRDLYLNSSDFLAPLNDERLHPNASAWKQNLLRIRNLILIGGPDDGVITPWQSRCDPKNPTAALKAPRGPRDDPKGAQMAPKW
uniref:palmitoyl-CoA hydrolase n=1 Tax=Gallus gallus TaxID=9031 RepID=A0A8V0X4I2_CHICK